MTFVLIFGAIGVGLRYAIDSFFGVTEGFPWNTFLINIAGCAVAGLIAGSKTLSEQEMQVWRTALMVGFCGGFTTFSAYSLQAVQLLERGSGMTAFVYALSSPVAGGIAAVAGIALGRSAL